MLSDFIRLAALAPPQMKSRLFFRCFSRLLARFPISQVTSNLGIRSSYSIQLNSPFDSWLAFGRPEHYTGEFGPLLLSRNLLPLCDNFIDVGAHRGVYVFFLRGEGDPKKPFFFLEPNPVLFRELTENIARNELSQVHGFPGAMGAMNGKATFFVDKVQSLCSSLFEGSLGGSPSDKISVDMVSFDEFVRSRNLSNLLVKVDIENAEFEFLKGATAEFPRIKFLIMEMLSKAKSEGFIQIAKKQLGMEAYYINDLRLEHSSDGTFEYVAPQYNWLFTRLSPAELQKTVGSQFQVICK